ncbi:MAG TPA: hypothetical protein VKT83_11525, partial [bacterium]|nr:hypothetical protein [bacterium]
PVMGATTIGRSRNQSPKNRREKYANPAKHARITAVPIDMIGSPLDTAQALAQRGGYNTPSYL